MRCLFLFHRWDRKTVLAGCRERTDCSRCGKAGEVWAAHSWGAWETYKESMATYKGNVKVKGSEYTIDRQRHHCVRCNICEKRDF